MYAGVHKKDSVHTVYISGVPGEDELGVRENRVEYLRSTTDSIFYLMY